MYINTVSKNVMLQLYLLHDFMNSVLKSNVNLYCLSLSPPLPKWKNSGCLPECVNSYSLSNSVSVLHSRICQRFVSSGMFRCGNIQNVEKCLSYDNERSKRV